MSLPFQLPGTCCVQGRHGSNGTKIHKTYKNYRLNLKEGLRHAAAIMSTNVQRSPAPYKIKRAAFAGSPFKPVFLFTAAIS
ncbi:hypothetical protein DCC81_13285 [Chitinophaga parva]|uniref:Uncharacterized protein n=1 Tax=Chitinophaga parva TaxID=2169414 RepID=A0A2T7BG71_9BACT|nr:hypothetical protein DCC81_13285 [Chitinophaga parva]